AEAEAARQDARRACALLLEAPSRDVRAEAAVSLGVLDRPRDPAAGQPVAELALARLAREPSLSVRARLARSLATLAPAEFLAPSFRAALARATLAGTDDLDPFASRSELVLELVEPLALDPLAP